VTLGPNLGVFPLDQTRHVGVAKSERPRLTNGEITFEEFQLMWSQFTNVTDRQTDRRHAIAIPRFTLKCIARYKRYSSSCSHLRATGHHLQYEITQCYLPPDTGERAPTQPQPERTVSCRLTSRILTCTELKGHCCLF